MQSKKETAVKTKTVTSKKRKLTKSDWQLYSLCLIPVLLVFVFNYIPMFGIIIAFKNYKYNLGIFGSEWVGFDNFEFFIKSDVFVQLVRNTILNNAFFIVCTIVAAVATGIAMYHINSRKFTKVYQTMLISPYFMSWVVVAYMVYAILNPTYGYLNQLLGLFGVEPIDWYSKPMAWPIILMICSVWKGVGVDSVYYYATLMGVDTSLFEAAEIDGANRWQIIWNIILPCLVPIIVLLTILKIGGIFRADFGLFYSVTQDGASGTLYETTNVIDTYIYRTFRSGSRGSYGLSSAVGLLQSFVGIVMVCATNAAAKKIDPDYGLF